MKGFCPLASGSTGNVLYLGTNKAKILIDVGLSFKKITEKLSEINVDIDEIDAVLLSHEHADHIKGLEMIVKKLNVPVLCNSDTAKAVLSSIAVEPEFKIFSTGEEFQFADMDIHPFSIQHDTLDPVGFTIFVDNMKIGICTDLGFVTRLIEHHLLDCDYLYIEANHDEKMVHNCSRPMLYKQRVLSRQGHLSNQACAKLLKTVYHGGLKHVYLAHLSSECNTPDLALDTVTDILKKDGKQLDLSIAHPHKISRKITFD